MQGYEGIQSHLEKGASRKSPGFHQLEYTDRFGRSVVWMYCARGLGQSLMTDGYGRCLPQGVWPGGYRMWFCCVVPYDGGAGCPKVQGPESMTRCIHRSLAAAAPSSAPSRPSLPARGGHGGHGNSSSSPSRINGPMPGIASPFLSGTAGRGEFDVRDATRAPGPAFYSPSTAPKRTSYHMNARKKMVP